MSQHHPSHASSRRTAPRPWGGAPILQGYLIPLLPMLALGIVFWVGYSSFRLAIEERLNVDATIQRVDIINKIGVDIFRAAGAAYAAFTIGEEGARERYHNAKLVVREDLDRLTQLNVNAPTQSEQVKDLRLLAIKRLALLEVLMATPSPLESLPEVAAEGRRAMLDLLSTLASMRQEENIILEQYRQDLEAAKSRLRIAFPAFLLVGVVGGAGGVFLFVYITHKRLHRIEQVAAQLLPQEAAAALPVKRDVLHRLEETVLALARQTQNRS